MKKSACAVALLVLSGCTYNASVPVSSASDDVLPMRRLSATAYLQVDQDLATLTRRATTGVTCAEHVYEIDAGRAISESLMQTLEGAFPRVVKVASKAEASSDGHIIRAQLSDFNVRLRFTAFFTPTTTATADVAIRVVAFDQVGNIRFQSTIRGEATIDETGGCNTGIETATAASKRAIHRAMEDLVHKMVNSGALSAEKK